MVAIPDSLVERLKRRQVALVSGLGCGELAGAPGWAALVEWLASRLPTEDDRVAVERLVAAGRLGDAVAFVRGTLGPDVLPDAIREAYPDGASVPDAVELALGLPWRAVLTTGFDDLWERANDNRGANGHAPTLMHLFGRAGLPDGLFLGPTEAHGRLTPSDALACLDDQRRTRSLVLIGFRATDPDLDWLTSWMKATPVTDGDVPHFLFLDVSRDTDPAAEARLVALRTGMTVIPCPGGTAEALDVLAQLSTDLDANRARYDADVDIQAELARWARDPADPEPRATLDRAAIALAAEQEWDRLIELLLGRFELLEATDEQLATLREAAAIFRGPLASPARALTTGLAALRLAPGDDELWEALRADAAATDGWNELGADAEEIARALDPTTPGAARIWRELGRLNRDRLARPEAAVDAFRASVDAEMGHGETRDELADLLRQLARWPELVSLLRAGALGEKDPWRASNQLLEVADIQETRLHDAPAAIAAFEGALAVDPESEPAWTALERLYETEGRWAELAALLPGRARRLPAPAAAARRRRRAEILVDRLADADTAAAELEEITRADPADRAALDLLDRIYVNAARVEDHLRVMQRRAELAPEPAQRLALLRELATLWEQRPDGGGLDQAADALEHLLRLDPRDGDAWRALTRVYGEARRPIALADVLERQIEATATGEPRVELYLALGRTYEQDLDDANRAYAAYAAAESSGHHTEDLYETLARLAERLQRWALCAEALQKWAEVTPELDARAEIWLQAAKVLADQVHDRAAAQAQLGRVLEIAPEHAGALLALAHLHRDEGDFERAVELLLRAEPRAASPAEKADLLIEAATLLRRRLGRDDRAAEVLTQALALDPESVAAAEPLADILYERRQWAEVEPLLDLLARRLDATDPASAAQLAMVQHRLGLVAREQGNADKTIACFAEALRLAPDALPILTSAADFRAARGEWPEAAALYATLLAAHGATLPAARVLDLTMQLGRCAAEQGNADAAIDWYQKAQALDPRHRPAIEALAALHASKEDWAALVRDKRALMTVGEPGAHADLLEEIGDLYLGKLRDPMQAEAVFRAALDAEPGRRSTLHRLLDLYTHEKSWRPAAETVVRLAEIEGDPAVRAKTLYTAALIRKDELGHFTEAADLLERALDEAPTLIEAFDVLEDVHRAASDWTELARSYRRMIRRLPAAGMNDLRLRLWSQMGELAQKRLHDPQMALAAFEVAVSLDPENLKRKEALADLYVQAGPAALDKAIAAHQHLVARNPDRLNSYRALAKLYADTRQFDKHWCVAATLSFLGKADAALEATFQRHRPPQLRLATRKFNEEVWQRVSHPDEDRWVGGLFALCGAALATPTARPHAAVGLKRKKRVDHATDPRVPARALGRVAETMDLPVPELYFAETDGAETALFNLQEKGTLTPTLLLGSITLRRTDPFELVFDLAKRMAFLRPDRFLRLALPTPAALELAMRVTLAVAGVSLAKGSDGGDGGDAAAAPGSETARLTDYLKKTLAPQIQEQLAALGPKFVAAHTAPIDFQRWIVATDLGAARAALLITGDLWAAARVISTEPLSQAFLAVRERLKDLVAFSVSEDYFTCRRLLGLDIT